MPPRHQHLFGGLQVKDSSNYVSHFPHRHRNIWDISTLQRNNQRFPFLYEDPRKDFHNERESKTKDKQESSQSKTHVQAHEPIIPKDRGFLSNPQVSRITVVHVLFEKKHSILVTSPTPQLAFSKKSQQPDRLRCP